MSFTPIHQHLIIKAHSTVPITSPAKAQVFLTDLVKLLGMVPVTEPQAVYVSEPGNEGLTGSINLATSHIAFHVWDKIGLLMIDIYSCKEFSNIEVINFIDKMWSIDTLSWKVLDRNETGLYDHAVTISQATE